MNRKIQILTGDDSAVVQQTLKHILDSDLEIEIMGLAADSNEATRQLQAAVPDVIGVDVEMPGMDGIIFLSNIIKQAGKFNPAQAHKTYMTYRMPPKAVKLGAVGPICSRQYNRIRQKPNSEEKSHRLRGEWL